jgi:hypothetical protein
MLCPVAEAPHVLVTTGHTILRKLTKTSNLCVCVCLTGLAAVACAAVYSQCSGLCQSLVPAWHKSLNANDEEPCSRVVRWCSKHDMLLQTPQYQNHYPDSCVVSKPFVAIRDACTSRHCLLRALVQQQALRGNMRLTLHCTKTVHQLRSDTLATNHIPGILLLAATIMPPPRAPPPAPHQHQLAPSCHKYRLCQSGVIVI